MRLAAHCSLARDNQQSIRSTTASVKHEEVQKKVSPSPCTAKEVKKIFAVKVYHEGGKRARSDKHIDLVPNLRSWTREIIRGGRSGHEHIDICEEGALLHAINIAPTLPRRGPAKNGEGRSSCRVLRGLATPMVGGMRRSGRFLA
eukprot:scaffold68994_cov28-Tisochrysis_lutea.AAC.5